MAFHRIERVEDQKGNTLPGWTVEVRLASDDTTVVPIFYDSAQTLPISGNRAAVDLITGNYDYWVTSGTYNEHFYDADGIERDEYTQGIPMYGDVSSEAQAAVADAEAAADLAQGSAVAVPYDSWTELVAVTGAPGDYAIVYDDAGTHTDPVTSTSVNNVGLYRWSASPAGWERIAPTNAVLAAGYRDEAQGFASDAEQSASAAQTAAELVAASGQFVYDSYADADADKGDIPDGQVVQVLVDETRSDGRTIYRLSSDTLNFVRELGSFSGGTLSSALTVPASTTGSAGLTVPPGDAPSSPNNGNIWTTTAGIFARIAGATRQLASLNGTEAFTNKTFDLTDNTVQGTPAEWDAAVQGDSFAYQSDIGDIAALDSVSNANWSGDDLDVTNGGTGASTAAAARSNLGAVGAASASDVRTGTATDVGMTPASLFAAAAPVTLTDAATIAVDMGAGINFNVTLGGNRTLGAPSNAKPGQSGRIRVTQDGTGGRTLSYASAWKPITATPVIETAAGKVNIFAYFVNDASNIELSYVGALA